MENSNFNLGKLLIAFTGIILGLVVSVFIFAAHFVGSVFLSPPVLNSFGVSQGLQCTNSRCLNPQPLNARTMPEVDSVPSGAAAARVVRLLESNEITFYDRRGSVIETVVLDVCVIGTGSQNHSRRFGLRCDICGIVLAEQASDSHIVWRGNPRVLRDIQSRSLA